MGDGMNLRRSPADKPKFLPQHDNVYYDRPLPIINQEPHSLPLHHSPRQLIMGPPRRKVLATAEETMFPPDELAETHQIVRAIKATGNNIYLIEQPDKTQMLVELPARFRSTFWIKRGSYVVVDTKASEERDNKIGGEIINIVRDEKAWRKAPFWLVLVWLPSMNLV